MDRAEAFKTLKRHKMTCLLSGLFDVYEALIVAIAALREQEQREQGCEYCTTEYDTLLPTDMGYTWIFGNELRNAYGSCEIHFCPMCGRKLPEPPAVHNSEERSSGNVNRKEGADHA